MYIDSTSSPTGLGKTKVVIDSGSPYITLYTSDTSGFTAFWQAITGSDSPTNFNCNSTTRLCDNTEIMEYMIIKIGSSTTGYIYNVTMYREDLLKDDYIQVYYDDDAQMTQNCNDCDYVLFLGYPFLKHTVVTLDYAASPPTVTFYGLKTTTSSLNWVTIGVVFGSVAAFALIFFGLYYWKYGRIPPPSNNDVEEQVVSIVYMFYFILSIV